MGLSKVFGRLDGDLKSICCLLPLVPDFTDLFLTLGSSSVNVFLMETH